jgi:ketosteroid isomerase-like protein
MENFNYSPESLAATIIALEKSALEKWNQGDPSPYLDLSADSVTYFDPYLDSRLDGLEALSRYYEAMRGLVHVTKYEMLNPEVNGTENMAVLSFNLISHEGEKQSRWNCTEAYRLDADGKWKIIQTHWSLVKGSQVL